MTKQHEDTLYKRIAEIIEIARGHVASSVNTAMVHAYWLVGREIVEVEQHGKKRASYGEELIAQLADRLSKRFGRGFGIATLRRARGFYLTFPRGSAVPELRGAQKRSTPLIESASSAIRSTPLIVSGRGPIFPPQLGWSHYLVLQRIENDRARAFYEIEAAREAWSVRELERQVAALLFERLAKSRNKEKVLALARKGHEVTTPADIIRDPFVIEFTGLPEHQAWLEHDLEQAIIDHLEDFLLELGKGFCFVARQKRLTLDADHFYVDLVFYNRLLRCFVLIDLKLGKLAHQDLGQMMMYVNWFDQFQRADHEAPTVGIVLCSEKNDAVVKITLPDNNRRVLAARYLPYLPTEDELRTEVKRSRDAIERRLRLSEPRPSGAKPPKRRAR